MASIIIKESDIRRYVRSLIREAYEVESAAPADPEDVAERDKMLSGQPYNRSKFPSGGKSFELEREYRKEMGYPALRKPHGGVVPYLIDADGNDITPGNKPDAIEYRKGKRKERKRAYDRERYAKKAYNLDTGQGKILSGDEQLAMSEEERAAYREKLRRDDVARTTAANEKMRQSWADSRRSRVKPNYDNEDEYGRFRWVEGIDGKGNTTRIKEYEFNVSNSIENLGKRLRYRIAKRDKLDDNPANDRLRDSYDMVINNLRGIIKRKIADTRKSRADSKVPSVKLNYDNEDEYGRFRWANVTDKKGKTTWVKEYEFYASNSIENLRKRLRYFMAKRDKLGDNDANGRLRKSYDMAIDRLRKAIKLKIADAARDKDMSPMDGQQPMTERTNHGKLVNEIFQELMKKDDGKGHDIMQRPISNVGFRKKPFMSPKMG